MLVLVITFLTVMGFGHLVNWIEPDTLDSVLVFAVAIKSVGVVSYVMEVAANLEEQQQKSNY